MIPNPHNIILFRQCDWKDNLDLADQRELLEHAENIGGEFIELDVYTADAKIFYSGPIGIQSWLNGRCAFEIFYDATVLIDKEGEEFAEVEEMYYYPETNQVWVSLNVFEEETSQWMSFEDLEKFAEENGPED
jgi:hypothetical protein